MEFFTNNIFADKIFYHVYPLGLGNCPRNNDYHQEAGNFFEFFATELDRIKNLGCNAIYFGPIFESCCHGYDTLDYYYIDRRLGNNQKFKDFCRMAHEKGFAIVLDGVFNHTGREFFAFKDIQKNGQNSQYKDWYLNLNFNQCSNYGDCFDYEGWAGCKDLVKLNLLNEDVQNHIFGAVKFWIEEFKIDGLRLDAADVIDGEFLKKLGNFCRGLKKNFWLMGEVVHGDYNNWCNSEKIDSVTNYQLYSALYSSVDNFNFYELAFNLNREFGQKEGLYKYAPLYNFLDNHDVNRVASVIKNPEKQLYMIYALLFAVPGIPSVYYGSEYGLKGKRGAYDDFELRPSLPPFSEVPDFAKPNFNSAFLPLAIKQFADLRSNFDVLKYGDYQEKFVSNRQFAFSRNYKDQQLLVICNCDTQTASIALHMDCCSNYEDLISHKYYSAKDMENFEIRSFDVRFLKRC
ncbi:MAG: alpha-amylase family glycosyl hydrolase [Treponema sp.]|nr:alpha-amylase family glycosyl hydrolase [Treponema sp.]